MKNKQISLKLTLREGCLDPFDPKLKLFAVRKDQNVGDMPPELIEALKDMMTDVGYLQIEAVEISDCDCEVE